MSVLDRERNVIVVRVVYDGPPEAGKTTSLRALAGSLGQPLYTPAEQDGRTLFFDWMDYTGGRFEGYQIRCQIVSVPGQRAYRKRRLHLLRDADVIVHVADSRPSELDATMKLLGEIPELLADREGPPVGLVVQANKRDLPGAVSLDEIRRRVRDAGFSAGIVESIASSGTGIREAFVFAIRLALDRVREQMRTNTLPNRRPEIDSGEALLEDLKRAAGDREPEEPVAAPAIREVLADNDEDSAFESLDGDDAPYAPDTTAPSGAIWPPVEGRIMLHEAAPARVLSERGARGCYEATFDGGWRAYSSRAAVYADLEAGREMLIRWARLHVASAGLVSPNRCIVLAATGDGRWRLWQILRVEKSMRDDLAVLANTTVHDAARRILETVASMCDLLDRSESAPWRASCALDTIGRGDRGPVYIGLMPMSRRAAPSSDDLADRIGADLASIIAAAWPTRRAEVSSVIAGMPTRGSLPSAMVDRMVSRMTDPRESVRATG